MDEPPWNNQVDHPIGNGAASVERVLGEGVRSGYTSYIKPALYVSRNTPVPEYMGVKDTKKLWEKLTTAYKTKLQLNIIDIRWNLFGLRLED